MITVCVSTFGDQSWSRLAERAIASAQDQADELIVEHQPEGTLASARNAAADRANGDHLVFLDADDELGAGYVVSMQDALIEHGDALLVPQVSYVTRGRMQRPKYWPQVSLTDGNWLVIGTMIPRAAFMAAGGFREYEAYEDWALFATLWRDGLPIVKVPEAVYVAHWSMTSRNKIDRETALRVHFQIGRDVFPERYPPDWLEAQTSRRGRHRRREVV